MISKKIYINNLKRLNDILKEDENGNDNIVDQVGKTAKKEIRRAEIKSQQLYEEYLGDNSVVGQTKMFCQDLTKTGWDVFTGTLKVIKYSALISILTPIIKAVHLPVWKMLDSFLKFTYIDAKRKSRNMMKSENYADFAKYYNSLLKLQKSDYYSNDAKAYAAASADIVKKTWLTLGVMMIVCSLILAVIYSHYTDLIRNIMDALKTGDFKVISKALAKAVGLGIIILPAFLGLVFIVLSKNNFQEDGSWGQLAKQLGPVIDASTRTINTCLMSFKSIRSSL